MQTSTTGDLQMFSKDQYCLIMEAVEDYAILVDEDISFKCEEINAIIQAHFDELH